MFNNVDDSSSYTSDSNVSESNTESILSNSLH